MHEIKEMLEKTNWDSTRIRPEIVWLQEKYKQFMIKNNIEKKSDADILIYEKMYAKLPEKSAEITKIRFWRSGQHLPLDRKQIDLFSRALDLNEEDHRYMMQNVMDKSDRIFTSDDSEDEQYKHRLQIMQEMQEEYLMKVKPEMQLSLTRYSHNLSLTFRHLYYCDAQKYVYRYEKNGDNRTRRSDSVSYRSELSRTINLIGEISRKTMIRHILILQIPYINKEIMNQRLVGLGFAPLKEEHTTSSGDLFDYLIIKLLEQYEKSCSGQSPEKCCAYMQEALLCIEEYMEKNHYQNLRPIYFKSLIK